jgi:neurofibromin 1
MFIEAMADICSELSIPLNPSHFIIDISSKLAQSEPQLTVDFLNEFFVGWDSFAYSQRPLSLVYMAAWLPNLRTNLISTEADTEKAREKVALIFRKLIEVAISDVALSTTLEQSVWPAVRQDEIYVEIFLEEVIKCALAFGLDDERTEILGAIIASLGTISIRGRLLSRLRKTLNRTSLRPTRQLPENTVWNEICILLRLCLSTSFDSGVQSQLFVPEIFHLVTMLANTGSSDTRLTVHRLLVNTIHAMCTSFELGSTMEAKVKLLLQSLSEPKQDFLSNISPHERTSLLAVPDSSVPSITTTESLAIVLSEITIVAAPTVDISNVWRSRWMSLVASTAFQNNPAIQPRAFTVMGCLAREDVDDDLLYQVLVALRSSLGHFMEDNSNEMLSSIITSLTKMMDKLPSASRYGLQLFWLALSLVRLVPHSLFNQTALFLEAVLTNIARSGDFADGRMAQVLLHGRAPLEDAALQLDEMYGIHFSNENFHFAVSACLVKGLTDSVTRGTTMRVYSSFLETTSSNMPAGTEFTYNVDSLPYVALLMSRSMDAKEARDSLWLAGFPVPNADTTFEDIYESIDLTSIKDKQLLLNTATALVDFRYLDDTVQNRNLIWLNKVTFERPTVILHL